MKSFSRRGLFTSIKRTKDTELKISAMATATYKFNTIDILTYKAVILLNTEQNQFFADVVTVVSQYNKYSRTYMHMLLLESNDGIIFLTCCEIISKHFCHLLSPTIASISSGYIKLINN